MALIKCSECGKEISDKANSCTHCGCPIIKKKKKKLHKKKWEELTNDEKWEIVSYRKFKKNWMTGSRILGIMTCIPGSVFMFLSIINEVFLIPGVVNLIVFMICFVMATKEQKYWYEKNVDRLYEEKILK